MNQKIKLIQGNYALALGFIKHIFGENELEYKGKKLYSWQLGLDYIKLLLTKPDQKLPVLLLYGQHAIGKSIFLEWLGYMTGNFICFNNDSFTNEAIVKEGLQRSLVICHDYMGSSTKSIERMKMWATAHNMGFDIHEEAEPIERVPVNARFAFASNTEVVKLALQHGKRFWLIEPKELTTKQPSMLKMLKEQTPAFLYWLINGLDLCTEEESSMWFPILHDTEVEAAQATNEMLDLGYDNQALKRKLDALTEDTENQAAQIEVLQKLVDKLKNTIDIGVDMRKLQKEFFKLRGQKKYKEAKTILDNVKPLEKEFDNLAKATLI